MDKKQIVEEFLKKNELCVISTLGPDGTPQSAVVAFTNTDDLTFIISTLNTTRKYSNIKSNPKSSMVIGWDPAEFKTIQMQGETIEAEDQEKYKKLHIERHPTSLEYSKKPENRYLIFKPTWIRYSDLQENVIFEL